MNLFAYATGAVSKNLKMKVGIVLSDIKNHLPHRLQSFFCSLKHRDFCVVSFGLKSKKVDLIHYALVYTTWVGIGVKSFVTFHAQAHSPVNL